MKQKLRSIVKKLFSLGATLAILIFVGIILINLGVILATESAVFTQDSLPQGSNTVYDCIIVLGCGVKPDGSPSDMLYDRVETAVALYQSGKAKKILMSGDHGREDYDEVNTMKSLAVSLGVPTEDVFMDHAGFSTYETMARAANVFGVKNAIIVTQEYHLYRALMLASSFDMEAVGISASVRSYAGQGMRDTRELAARAKDTLFAIVKPSYVTGEPIDITGSGDVTNDR